jgi:hypothetical protein
MRHIPESNLKIEYLREYEFIFETALAHESGDPSNVCRKKTEGRKSRYYRCHLDLNRIGQDWIGQDRF